MSESTRRRAGSPRTALVLAAHGSTKDPLANALVRGQAERVRATGLFDEVAVAFHQGEPGYSAALDSITATSVVVVPFLTSSGYYARVVLPRELRKSRRFHEISLRVTDPVGTHPAVAAIVKRRASGILRHWKLERPTLAIVGHGTQRHPESRKATDRLVESLRRERSFCEVISAFLDEEPSVESIPALATGSAVVVVPFLIAGGGHANQDIPARLGLRIDTDDSPPFAGTVEGRLIVCDVPIGSDPAIRDIILDLALPERSVEDRDAIPPGAGRGAVYLVGAGPGDPGLITVRGLELLRRADVVVHDRLVAAELIAEARADAEIVDAGKEPGTGGASQDAIHARIIDRARRGLLVVRLKGGDPFLFGRGWEELEACRAAGVPCTVVPGVPSATAVPAAARIPVTLRGVGRSVAVVTARTEGGPGPDEETLRALAALDTVVILMGLSNLEEVLEGLVRAGRSPDTPAACIEKGTTSGQKVVVATLATLAQVVEQRGLESPVTTVVGDVVRCAGGVPCAAEAPRFTARAGTSPAPRDRRS